MRIENAWAIIDNNESRDELIRTAAACADVVTAVSCKQNELFSLSIPSMADMAAREKPALVFTSNTKNGRLAAGAIAARLGTTVLTDPAEVTMDKEYVEVTRLVYGGAGIKTERVTRSTAVICAEPGLLDPGEITMSVRELEVSVSDASMQLLGKHVKENLGVSIKAAAKVVCAGRGVESEAVLRQIEELAGLVGAEMGCTRPVSEENKWMPSNRYIGVSGVMLKPNFYLAMGVSGQVQHMVGCNQARSVFAVNKDKNAPIFKQCDYGLVGGIAQVLPAIIEKLKA